MAPSDLGDEQRNQFGDNNVIRWQVPGRLGHDTPGILSPLQILVIMVMTFNLCIIVSVPAQINLTLTQCNAMAAVNNLLQVGSDHCLVDTCVSGLWLAAPALPASHWPGVGGWLQLLDSSKQRDSPAGSRCVFLAAGLSVFSLPSSTKIVPGQWNGGASIACRRW